MAQSALITNLYLMSRTGSELHALELARGLARRGWRVTCYALLVGEPLRSQLLGLDGQVCLVEFGQEKRLEPHYDLLVAQHHVVSDYVSSNLGITFDHVVVSILGSSNENEVLPDCADACDCVSFVSKEALAACETDLAALPSSPPTFLFSNYATSEYFDRLPRDLPKELPHRVAIISNHVPEEVWELRGRLERLGALCDVHGMQTRSVDVTPELLGSYDVVVTIGRTVQQCLACGTPVFWYDQFGGPGYITRDNALEHAEKNFSGRSCPVRRTAEELVHDLLGTGYARAVEDREALRDLARDSFDFDRLLDGLLAVALDPSRPRRAIGATAPRSRLEKNRMLAAYLRDVIDLNAYGVAQLFYGRDAGDVDAGRSLFVRYQYGCDIKIALSEIPPTYRLVRFDPDDTACVCQLETEGLVPARPCRGTDEGDHFVVDDPFYVTPDALDVRELVFCVRPLPRAELLERQQERIARLEEGGEAHGALRRLISRVTGGAR